MTGPMSAPGLSGDYLNAWLAALGVTVLVEGARLHWTDDRVPLAVLTPPNGVDLVEGIAAALPSVDGLDELAIASPKDSRRFPWYVDVVQYGAAAVIARERRDFSLAASVTDLVREPRDGRLPHSKFDPAVEQGRTLWARLRACRTELDRMGPSPDAVRNTLSGTAVRVELNGLGFDFRRIPAGSQTGARQHADPMLECLAFFGLAFFPMRGAGSSRAWTRGWAGPSGKSRFCWPTWAPDLDRWGVDALLSVLFAKAAETWRGLGLGVTGVYEAVEFTATVAKARTFGFASRRMP